MGAPNQYVRSTVIQAAKSTIAGIDQFRKQQLDKELKPLMQPYKRFGWFGRTITRSREEAYESLDTWTRHFAENALHGRRKECALILRAAEAHSTSDYFNLTKEEFDNIRIEYNKGEQ